MRSAQLLTIIALIGFTAAPTEAATPPLVTPLPRVALPHLADGLGWKQPMYYTTIQTADVDSDGQSEVLARWIDGLEIYRFENGTLFRHSRIAALSDNAGFYQPSWYSTIRAAVLEPSLHRADVVARQRDGIHVYRYDPGTRAWRELGANASLRPFADIDTGGTDWTQEKYYSTIRVADLTGDGAAELVGRGRNGLQVWRWQPASESWTRVSMGGELADAQGFDAERYYASIQLIDLDRDGVAELVVRASSGMQSYRWNGNAWAMTSSRGPFADDAGFGSGNRHRSIRTFVDAKNRTWLYGIAVRDIGPATIDVHRWDNGRWQFVQAIVLPGSGWEREQQFATLMAADLDADGEPEFVVRGGDGLHAFALNGRALPIHAQSFTDATGWNLRERYATLQPATALFAGTPRGVVIGRGAKGLEVYKLSGTWQAAAESNFPQFCTNFSTDTSPSCLAYKAISNTLSLGQVDIRSQYADAKYDYNTFHAYQTTVREMKNPIGPADAAAWTAVQTEMVQELGYAATVTAWFDNNLTMLNEQYKDASGLLNQAIDDVDLSTSSTVVSKWVEFAGDVTSNFAFLFEGTGEGVGLVISILDDLYGNLTAPGDVSETIDRLQIELNDQVTAYPAALSRQLTDYLTDYSKLAQVGRDKETGGFDWANATKNDITKAAQGARGGMLINFYRSMLPSRWQVYWCDGNGYGGGPDCGGIDWTPDKYFCQYGPKPFDDYGSQYTSNAYIWPGYTSKVNYGLLDRLTGPLQSGTNNLNAIWFMMMLGGDLGWDFQQWGLAGQGSYQQTPDPYLAYDRINHGYNGPGSSNAGCNGNGSTAGILSGKQSLTQRLSVAQHNSRRVTASEAAFILDEIGALYRDTQASAPTVAVAIDLGSSLEAAAELVARAILPTRAGVEGSASATTATHLTERFVRRVQAQAQVLGAANANRLAVHGYCLMAQLQGQTLLREHCTSAATRAQ